MALSGVLSGLQISASGMRAQRIRQNAISSNLANAETTRTDSGGPYRRKFVVFTAESDRRDVRLLNREVALAGRSTQENHLTIPPENFPRDERFFW
jgi:flagellar basal-body rod protein FlgC